MMSNLSLDRKGIKETIDSRRTRFPKQTHNLQILLVLLLCIHVTCKDIFDESSSPYTKDKSDKEYNPTEVLVSHEDFDDYVDDYDDDTEKDEQKSKQKSVEQNQENDDGGNGYEYDDQYYDEDDDAVNPCQRFWSCMGNKKRKAAKNMGYTKQLWNDGNDIYDGVSWAELSEAQQGNATIIGYTAEQWDDEPLYCLGWDGLDNATRAHARLLGFGRNSWNFDCAEWSIS